MSFRNCSTRSTISITHRPAFSRSMAKATWSISMPRSPTGSIRIWRRSAPAVRSCPTWWLATALRYDDAAGGAGRTEPEVLDLDLKTRSGRKLPVRRSTTCLRRRWHARRVAHARAQSRAGRRHRSAARGRRSASCASSTTRDGDRDRRSRGRIVGTNPLFARLFHDALNLDSGSRGVGAMLAERVALRSTPRWRQRPAAGRHCAGRSSPCSDGQQPQQLLCSCGQGERARPGSRHRVHATTTAWRRARERVAPQQQKIGFVGQLAGGIAHDFDDMLSAIIMATDFLLNAHKPTNGWLGDIMQISRMPIGRALVGRFWPVCGSHRGWPISAASTNLDVLFRWLIRTRSRSRSSTAAMYGRWRRNIWQLEQVMVNIDV